jgi:hypothetical protein
MEVAIPIEDKLSPKERANIGVIDGRFHTVINRQLQGLVQSCLVIRFQNLLPSDCQFFIEVMKG